MVCPATAVVYTGETTRWSGTRTVTVVVSVAPLPPTSVYRPVAVCTPGRGEEQTLAVQLPPAIENCVEAVRSVWTPMPTRAVVSVTGSPGAVVEGDAVIVSVLPLPPPHNGWRGPAAISVQAEAGPPVARTSPAGTARVTASAPRPVRIFLVRVIVGAPALATGSLSRSTVAPEVAAPDRAPGLSPRLRFRTVPPQTGRLGELSRRSRS